MKGPKLYILGAGKAEEMRLKWQTSALAPDSDALFERIGIRQGEHVLDIGCGPGGVLHLLGKHVGPSGSVVAIDKNPLYVELAREFVANNELPQVEVRVGDAFDTGLPRASFDGAHMRLLLVNVPEPEDAVKEMVSLVRPGGWVASFEADCLTHNCDPPHPAWRRLYDIYLTYSAMEGVDLFIGRRAHRLFRAAGIVDIRIDAVVHVYPPGHERRTLLLDFITNVHDKLIEGGFAREEELAADKAAVRRHLADPNVTVTSHLFYRLSGRVPRESAAIG